MFGLKMILMTSNLILALKRVSGSQQLPNVKYLGDHTKVSLPLKKFGEEAGLTTYILI